MLLALVFLAAVWVAVSLGASAATEPPPKAADPNAARTVAVVNDAVISNFDLDQRIRLLIVTSGQTPNPDMVQRVRPQVLRTLVDEMLQTQEAFKYKVNVQQEEIDKSLARIAQSNNMQVADIFKMLEGQGVSRTALQGQLRAEIAWQKLVQGRLAPRVAVSPEEVQEVLARTTANAAKAQFLVSEIFLAVDGPEQEAEARKQAENLRNQMGQGAPFSALARQFSQSSSAGTGGDIGWVSEGQLEAELNAVLVKMRPGTVSDPIKTVSGIYILALRQKQTAAGSKPEAADQPAEVPAQPAGPAQVKIVKGPSAQIGLARILIPLDATAPKAKQDAAREKAIKLYRGANGCGAELNQLAGSLGVQVMNMGKLPYNDLDGQFKKILEQTPNGRSTPPLRSAQGIEMFVVCSGGSQIQVTQAAGPAQAAAPRTEPFKMPTKEDIENRLFQQQLSMMSRRYLRDLRRDATIEIREE
jgi:peptidyl-prolyl cis-trans isomerase SurA